ncbi:MAG: DUF3306 domain-containing protein [Arhodomonas sp.]|nr:DUF3306 domain-containing protein [Arhodomonas sp.]
MTTADDPQGGDPPGGEPFLRRWSRRKRDVGDDTLSPGAIDAPETTSVPEATPGDDPEGSGDPAVLTDDDMPPVESLTEDTDVSGFFSEGSARRYAARPCAGCFACPSSSSATGWMTTMATIAPSRPSAIPLTSDMRLQAERRLAAEQDQAATDEVSRADGPRRGSRRPPRRWPLKATSPGTPAHTAGIPARRRNIHPWTERIMEIGLQALDLPEGASAARQAALEVLARARLQLEGFVDYEAGRVLLVLGPGNAPSRPYAPLTVPWNAPWWTRTAAPAVAKRRPMSSRWVAPRVSPAISGPSRRGSSATVPCAIWRPCGVRDSPVSTRCSISPPRLTWRWSARRWVTTAWGGRRGPHAGVAGSPAADRLR